MHVLDGNDELVKAIKCNLLESKKLNLFKLDRLMFPKVIYFQRHLDVLKNYVLERQIKL